MAREEYYRAVGAACALPLGVLVTHSNAKLPGLHDDVVRKAAGLDRNCAGRGSVEGGRRERGSSGGGVPRASHTRKRSRANVWSSGNRHDGAVGAFLETKSHLEASLPRITSPLRRLSNSLPQRESEC